MNHRLAPTPFTDVNFVLDHFRSQLQALLDSELVGIYLVGSLALGDFNPRSSDIDFVVVTSTEIDPDRFTALQHVHAQFAASNSPWAEKIEAIDVPASALRHSATNTSQSTDRRCFYSTRRWMGFPMSHHSAEPDSQTLRPNWTQELHAAATMIDGYNRQPICISLSLRYSLATGTVASKPRATEWARKNYGEPCQFHRAISYQTS